VVGFIVSPYLLMLVVAKVVRDLDGVRTALAPTLMTDGIKNLDEDHNHDGVSLYSCATSIGNDTPRTPPRKMSLHPGRMMPPQPMQSEMGDDSEDDLGDAEEQPLVEAVTLEATDHLTVVVPLHTYRLFEHFVLRHQADFAPVYKLPYVMDSLDRLNENFPRGSQESPRRLSVMNTHKKVTDIPWLARVMCGYWSERDDVDAIITPHEELFIGMRQGPRIVQAIAQLVLLWTAVYLSVLITTLLPLVIWSDEVDLELSTRVTLTVVACAPPFLIYGQVCSLIEVFAIVSHSGMMRVPRVVMKVLRSTRTRRSLGVLKLLSAVAADDALGPEPEDAVSPALSADGEGPRRVRFASSSGSINNGDQPKAKPGWSIRRRPSLKRGDEKRRQRQAEQTASHAFEVCDDDSSGLVNYVEFKTLLESLGMRKSESELQAICSDLDADNSGEIDRDEFIHWFSNLQLRTNCDLSTPENIGRFVDHIFCVIDKDNSDNISTEEVR
jgi:Ca2+-binding EF-hand superfamily protein